jgi:hypothetical protein
MYVQLANTADHVMLHRTRFECGCFRRLSLNPRGSYVASRVQREVEKRHITDKEMDVGTNAISPTTRWTEVPQHPVMGTANPVISIGFIFVPRERGTSPSVGMAHPSGIVCGLYPGPGDLYFPPGSRTRLGPSSCKLQCKVSGSPAPSKSKDIRTSRCDAIAKRLPNPSLPNSCLSGEYMFHRTSPGR